MDALISVVIPVYNVEKYIRRCLASIISQTYKDLEIILVDDGSTDRSGEICDEIAQIDGRIQVIHKDNGGLSSARNVGKRAATGEFIAFVDSDDFVHPAMYELMLAVLLESGSDIAISDIFYIDEDDIKGFPVSLGDEIPDTYICIEKDDLMQQMVERDVVTVVQWNKLFKRCVLDGIEYPEGRYHEDVYVIHKQLYNCKKAAYLDARLYYYVQRKGSIMHAESEKMIQDAVDGYLDRISFMEDNGLESERERAVAMLLSYVSWKFEMTALGEGYSEKCAWLGEMFQRSMRCYPEYDLYKKKYRLLAGSPYKYYEAMVRKQNKVERKKRLHRILDRCFKKEL